MNKKTKHKKLLGGNHGYNDDDRILCEYTIDDDNNYGVFVKTKDTLQQFINSILTFDRITIHDVIIIKGFLRNFYDYIYYIHKKKYSYDEYNISIEKDDGRYINNLNTEDQRLFNYKPPIYTLLYYLKYFISPLNEKNLIISRLLLHFYIRDIMDYKDIIFNQIQIIVNNSIHNVYTINNYNENNNSININNKLSDINITLTEITSISILFPLSVVLISKSFDDVYEKTGDGDIKTDFYLFIYNEFIEFILFKRQEIYNHTNNKSIILDFINNPLFNELNDFISALYFICNIEQNDDNLNKLINYLYYNQLFNKQLKELSKKIKESMDIYMLYILYIIFIYNKQSIRGGKNKQKKGGTIGISIRFDKINKRFIFISSNIPINEANQYELFKIDNIEIFRFDENNIKTYLDNDGYILNPLSIDEQLMDNDMPIHIDNSIIYNGMVYNITIQLIDIVLKEDKEYGYRFLLNKLINNPAYIKFLTFNNTYYEYIFIFLLDIYHDVDNIFKEQDNMKIYDKYIIDYIHSTFFHLIKKFDTEIKKLKFNRDYKKQILELLKKYRNFTGIDIEISKIQQYCIYYFTMLLTTYDLNDLTTLITYLVNYKINDIPRDDLNYLNIRIDIYILYILYIYKEIIVKNKISFNLSQGGGKKGGTNGISIRYDNVNKIFIFVSKNDELMQNEIELFELDNINIYNLDKYPTERNGFVINPITNKLFTENQEPIEIYDAIFYNGMIYNMNNNLEIIIKVLNDDTVYGYKVLTNKFKKSTNDIRNNFITYITQNFNVLIYKFLIHIGKIIDNDNDKNKEEFYVMLLLNKPKIDNDIKKEILSSIKNDSILNNVFRRLFIRDDNVLNNNLIFLLEYAIETKNFYDIIFDNFEEIKKIKNYALNELLYKYFLTIENYDDLQENQLDIILKLLYIHFHTPRDSIDINYILMTHYYTNNRNINDEYIPKFLEFYNAYYKNKLNDSNKNELYMLYNSSIRLLIQKDKLENIESVFNNPNYNKKLFICNVNNLLRIDTYYKYNETIHYSILYKVNNYNYNLAKLGHFIEKYLKCFKHDSLNKITIIDIFGFDIDISTMSDIYFKLTKIKINEEIQYENIIKILKNMKYFNINYKYILLYLLIKFNKVKQISSDNTNLKGTYIVYINNNDIYFSLYHKKITNIIYIIYKPPKPPLLNRLRSLVSFRRNRIEPNDIAVGGNKVIKLRKIKKNKKKVSI